MIEIVSIFLGAVLAWLSTLYFQYRLELAQQKRLLTVIFGELLNIRRHYAYAGSELPDRFETRSDWLPLEMSVYGDLSFNKDDLSRLGFLQDRDIADLIQLSLKIRNTDLCVEMLLEQLREKKGEFLDVEYLRNRMDYVSGVVDRIIIAISQRNYKLHNVMPDIDELNHEI